MIHKHQFVRACGVEMPKPGITNMHSVNEGSRYVCIEPECGEVRDVWNTGSVAVVKKGLPDKDELE